MNKIGLIIKREYMTRVRKRSFLILTFFSASPNELLNQLLQVGQLVSFKEVLPSMNDIFIQEVQSQNQAS